MQFPPEVLEEASAVIVILASGERIIMIPHLTPRRRSSRQQLSGATEEPRSRSGSTSHHHHQHSHHHHHYHQHHHHQNQRSRTARTQYVGGFSDPLQQPSSSISDIASSSRALNFHGESSDRTRLPLLMQRRTETDAHRVALEARGRLDERLREAALLGRRNAENSLPRLAQYYFNALFSEEDQDSLLWEDEHEWEASLRDWLAGQVPSLRESWQPEWMNDLSSTPMQGLSKDAVNTLPREIYGQKSKLTGMEGGVSEQVDCSVCLEAFVPGQMLLCLPCKHKFHSGCLTPWLDSHEQCPYCRAQIISTGLSESQKSSSHLNGEDNLLSWLEAFETGMSRLR